MVNILKLKGKIVEMGYKTEELASAIQLDKATLYRKLKKDGQSFTVEEANRIVKVLGLTEKEALSIFFADISE